MSASDRAATHAALAANVRRLRIAARLSLSQLAAATGVGKATLSGIERGQGNATIDTVSAIAAALRVSPAELLAAPAVAAPTIVRASSPPTPRGPGGPARRLDTLATEATTSVWELTLAERERRELEPAAAGSRALHVLAGSVVAGPAGQISQLDAGDWLSCPATVPFQLEAERRPARLLLLLSHSPLH
ncbi:helix-turn-helix transcriptional regulator [Conexibacter sp. JD483]|uniref:helix-turn-helix domain-containing protein n=1 Tax=unclassified Conexibacter TaxID=2627773 RepID=UPI002722C10A|nr:MULTISPECIES: helix-turn-helix transcriptional regulator [unclassified Conexibacter]MDO8185650.1 helix-turn-helix transcriptional regulator [Conexibacter sp. CPCC 205706]MDO8198823.1 helix-turn-helix transcriptional regulator [Conexibacter sp. CPCC 205762]MDR9367827.1 helix-turn-helix transcriptional regulator [Conexibacter sp. JD483]